MKDFQTTVKYVRKDICEDLLEALEDMVNVFSSLAGDCQDKEQAVIEENTVIKAYAAIAKARGRENE